MGNTEQNPERSVRNKGHIDKVMFLAAVARPRFDSEGNCTFDGIWPYTEWIPAKRRSPNRPKGTLELMPCSSVGVEKSREYLIKFVLPAIKVKWPAEDRGNIIYIQQDNAKTHIQPTDSAVCAAAMADNWNIRIVFQPPNSPDTNILDLGLFNCIQSIFQKKMPKTLPEIVAKVEKAFQEYHDNKGNHIFLGRQACMREIIRQKGFIHYALPHIRKKVMERLGILPIRLTVEPEFVQAAIAFVNSFLV